MQRGTLVFRTLLAVARQRAGFDESRCRLVLELLSASTAVNIALHERLESAGLSELRFAALVVLFVLHPSPATPAEIATHTGVTRSAITDVLDRLEADNLVTRQRDTTDRRVIYIHVTDQGRAAADAALTRYLEAAGQTARFVTAASSEQLLNAFAEFHAGAAQTRSASSVAATTVGDTPPLSP